jgi:hypothetical protein
MGEVYQLVYLSMAQARFDEVRLEELSLTAQRKNTESGVTGLLLFDGVRFIQALEGPKPAVLATMARIRQDDRHGLIDTVAAKAVDGRQFGDWSMQFKRVAPGSCSREWLRSIHTRMAPVEDATVKAMFLGFALLGCDRTRPKSLA